MRVIAGIAKGHKLLVPEGLEVRPTADRIKQSLFNMIQFSLIDAVFLDLFSGTGSIGIEALSRGASHCTFVDSSKASVDCIVKNIAHTKMQEKSYVLLAEAEDALHTIAEKGRKYNIIFMDPPYGIADRLTGLISSIERFELVEPEGLIIMEHGADLDLGSLNIKVIKQKSYGKTTAITFFSPYI